MESFPRESVGRWVLPIVSWIVGDECHYEIIEAVEHVQHAPPFDLDPGQAGAFFLI